MKNPIFLPESIKTSEHENSLIGLKRVETAEHEISTA